MSDLQVPKRRVSVELHALGGEPRAMTMFLSEYAPGRAGAERVSDVLARADAFFPALDHATDRMTFVNRAAVAIARVDRALEPGEADEAAAPIEHEVEVALLDGTVVRGVVSYVLAPGRARTVEYLNGPSPFLPLRVPGDDVLLVNKQLVARVTLVDAHP